MNIFLLKKTYYDQRPESYRNLNIKGKEFQKSLSSFGCTIKEAEKALKALQK